MTGDVCDTSKKGGSDAVQVLVMGDDERNFSGFEIIGCHVTRYTNQAVIIEGPDRAVLGIIFSEPGSQCL